MSSMLALMMLLSAPLVLACWSAAQAEALDCNAAIRLAEQAEKLPRGLLAAMAKVESGRRTAQGRIEPWPWTINARGKGHAFETRAEALDHVRLLQAEGTQSIDVGCLQINLRHHPQAFSSLEEAFSPMANARYAARFLAQLKAQAGNWMLAVAHYHSAQSERGSAYRQRVLLAMQNAPLPETGRMVSSWLPQRLPNLYLPGHGDVHFWLRSTGALPRVLRR